MRDKKMEPNDRIVHELNVLIGILTYMACYDQLNGPCLASMEIVARRVQQIVDAYSIPGKPPNWDMAKHLGGKTDPTDVVSKDLRAWAARQAKDEVDIASVRARQQTQTRTAATAADDGQGGGCASDSGYGGGGRGSGRGNGRGRGRGSRALGPQ